MTDDEIAAFERDGFLIQRGVVDSETLAGVQRVFEDAVDRLADSWVDAGVITDPAKDESFDQRWNVLRAQLPALYATAWRRILVSPEVYALWQHPALLGPARQLMGDEVIAHSIWNGRPRDSGGHDTQRIHWHQDAHYYKQWDKSDGKLISAWLPLVPVDGDSGCLQMGPGTHKRGLVKQVPSVNGLRTVADEDVPVDVVTASMEPGDVLFFTDLTLHRALDNHAGRVRWSIDIRFGEATEPVVRKSGRGYICHSADASKIESFEQWKAKFEFTLDELSEELGSEFRGSDAATAAKALGTSQLDIESY
ncbi:MAG: phytanoyl-CoA hydroxylase [Actinomycetota bacterium]|jgi:ectoine hydroxylase-related dioxygenase (phytanoyl-CoA dioxygenase family)